MLVRTRSFGLLWVVGGWLILAGSKAATAEEASLAESIAALKSPDQSVRLKAIDQLASLGEKASGAVAPLVEQLNDRSATVRAHAIHALGEIGPPAKAAAAAIVATVADPDDTVRRQAVGALLKIRPGPEITLPLFIKLMEDADPGVRVRVLRAVAEAGPQAVPRLVEALNNDKAAYWVCLVLRDMGPAAKEAVGPLARKLSDPRPEIRREATLALAAIGDAAAPAVPQIAAMLDDPLLRTPATYALGSIGRIPADAEAQIRAHARSDDKLLATTSLWALARVHPEDKQRRREATEQLVERLKDADARVRQAAAYALIALPPAPEITIPAMEKAFQGADQTTIQYAVDAIAVLGAPAVPRLIDALKYEGVRARVASILGEIGPAAAPAADALAGLVEDKDPRVADEAVMALAKIGPGASAAVPALLRALQRAEDSSRYAIAYALGRIGPAAAEAKPALEKLLTGEDDTLSLVSAWALVQIGAADPDTAARVVPVLIGGLARPDARYRQEAARALEKLGPRAKDALPALNAARGDADQAVREAVARALKAIGQ